MLTTGAGHRTVYVQGWLPSVGMDGIDPDQREETIRGLQEIAGPDILIVDMENLRPTKR